MRAPSDELQAHVRTRLIDVLDPGTATTVVTGQDTSDLSNIHERIFDNVPDDVQFPYIRFGQFNEDTGEEADCIDGTQIDFRVQVFSDTGGKKQCKKICHLIKKALHEWGEEMADNGLSETFVNDITIFNDPDGRVVQGVVMVTAFVEDLTGL